MHTVALAALLTVLPSAPPRITNQLPVAVTQVRVAGPAGTPVRVIPRVAAGRSVEVPGALSILSFALPACGAQAREAISAGGDLLAARACLQSRTLRTPALDSALARGLGDDLGT